MFLKMKTTVGEHQAGSVISCEDGIARTYIEAGLAEESNADSHMQAMIKHTLEEATSSIRSELEEVKRSLGANQTSDGPPSKGLEFDNGVPTGGKIENGTASVDRSAKGNEDKSFAEITTLIFKARPAAGDPVERSWAHERLTKSYGLDVVGDGQSRSVNRSGSESLSGGSSYGYLVKPEYYGSIFEIAMQDSVIEPFAFNVPIGATNELQWPALDQYFSPEPGNSAALGGVQVFRRGEATQRTPSDGKLRNITFKPTDLTGLTFLSRDLLADNYIAADALIQRLFARAMAWKKDWEFLNADGVGKPLGLRNSAAVLTVNRTTASQINFSDIAKMLAAFHQAYLKNAIFIANQTTYVELLGLKEKTGDSTRSFAFQPNAMVNQATPYSLISGTSMTGDMKYRAHGTLGGIPIYFTENLPVLGTSGDIMLIDASQYGVATRQGLEIGMSDHFMFDTDQIAYRFKLRNDGQPLWKGPYVSADGSNTKFSPFVQLS